jgi:hypothetical protein
VPRLIGAVDFAGGDLNKALDPVFAGQLQQDTGTDYIGADEIGRREDVAVDMALSGKIDHRIVTMSRDDLFHDSPVSDVGSDELVALTKTEREIGRSYQ